MGKMVLLALLVLGVSAVYCDTHSIRCYKTIASTPALGLPLYSLVVYFDDLEIVNYTSDTRQYLPKVEWIKKLDPEYWEWETRRTSTNQPFHIQHLQRIMQRFNHTGGMHVLQSMYGCELRDDGTTSGYNTYGYDGSEFMFLDIDRGIWIPTMQEAQISTEQYNSPNVRRGEVNKRDVEVVCVEYLKKFIDYGREDVERRVRPEVKVWGRQSDGVTKLQCLAYGFHPRAVDVKWVKNGEYDVIPMEAKTVLPHPDGTYQLRVSVEVPTNEEDSYSCHVDHSSLKEPIIVLWSPSTESGDHTSAVVCGIIVVAVALIVAVGVIFYKRRRGRNPVNGEAYEPATCE